MSHDRKILRIGGADRESFLQGLVTNDLGKLTDGLVYAALLTPQGKYLADFFLVPWQDAILVDVAASRADDLARRLAMYKLRADVTVEPVEIGVRRGTGPAPEGAFADPRLPELGWRAYGEAAGDEIGQAAWDALRVAHTVPETDVELVPNDSYILEAGFDRLNGVDFRKGCFVGQEIVARMKHKSELNRALVRVAVEGAVPVGTPVEADGKPVGTLFTQADGAGLAHLRLKQAGDQMQAGEATLRLLPPAA